MSRMERRNSHRNFSSASYSYENLFNLDVTPEVQTNLLNFFYWFIYIYICKYKWWGSNSFVKFWWRTQRYTFIYCSSFLICSLWLVSNWGTKTMVKMPLVEVWQRNFSHAIFIVFALQSCWIKQYSLENLVNQEGYLFKLWYCLLDHRKDFHSAISLK